MLRFLADQNFDHRIVRGMLQRNPRLDITRVQDVGLSRADDVSLLAWSARNGRILITHDVSTMANHAYQRVKAGEPMPGVIEVPRLLPVRLAIEDLLLLAECSLEGEWEGRVLFLPL